ncbi:MAG: butyrate kinase [Candidatus Riflebacteria bacterium]|nr:butyrate kinase [Candidatus Riflebacteria bacterium]
MKNHKNVIVINPGAATTKIALYTDKKELWSDELFHAKEEIAVFKSSIEQLEYRKNKVLEALEQKDFDLADLDAAIGRGGPVKPLPGGVYKVGPELLKDLSNPGAVDHASILGGLIAYELSKIANVPAYIADPISVDEFDDLARISGLPEIKRPALSHALNVKAVALEIAEKQGKKLEEVNYIVAHLGSGFTISPLRNGRIIDTNSANDAGPMTPMRSGTLPNQAFVKLCYSGEYTYKEMMNKLLRNSGLTGHLGTSDVKEISARIANGDEKARLCLEAMAYQISKDIGACAAILKGDVDAIILTGGVAYDKNVVGWITERVSFIAPIIVRPGQKEMQALADHAFNALDGTEIANDYATSGV